MALALSSDDMPGPGFNLGGSLGVARHGAGAGHVLAELKGAALSAEVQVWWRRAAYIEKGD